MIWGPVTVPYGNATVLVERGYVLVQDLNGLRIEARFGPYGVEPFAWMQKLKQSITEVGRILEMRLHVHKCTNSHMTTPRTLNACL